MDEDAESPLVTTQKDANVPEEEKDESGDEEQMLDWSKFAPNASKWKVTIPKKGEKSFEPIAMGPDAYQRFTLDRARQAMAEALSAPREIQTKRLSQAIWMPQYSRAKVIDNRGTTLDTVGYSIRREGDTQKRLELLPEEILYFVERGSMLCWKEPAMQISSDKELQQDSIQIVGEPMSAQQCFAEMLGLEGITLEHYQVYSYLKRFGYIVRRAQALPGIDEYTSYRHAHTSLSLLQSIKNKLFQLWAGFSRLMSPNWWTRFQPGIVSYFGKAHYPSLFKSFRVIPSHIPQRLQSPRRPSAPYEVFFHIWKPESPWNRRQVSRPDFNVVVINARESPVPSIQELIWLFGTVPAVSIQLKTIAKPTNWLERYMTWVRGILGKTRIPKANPFVSLKAGKRPVILAVVDAGTTSMFRFSEGCFDEWPMI